MTLAYVVRCNFKDPAREQAWNEWYSGPKLRQMLDKPHFLTGQRFRRTGGDGRDYLAFWTLASAEAFTTPEYTNDWGFFEWAPSIGDWSRDLFEGADGDVAAPAPGGDAVLRLVSFEGLEPEAAEAARRTVDASRPGLAWLRSVGLDRHTALLAVGIDDASDTLMDLPAGLGAHEATYRPISERARSRAMAAA